MDSESTSVAERVNPVHGFAGRALAALDGVADAAGDGDDAAGAGRDAGGAGAAGLTGRRTAVAVLAAADRNEIGAKDGSTSTAAWLARATRENRSKTNGDLRGARALDEQRFAVTRSAFAAGRLTEDQAGDHPRGRGSAGR